MVDTGSQLLVRPASEDVVDADENRDELRVQVWAEERPTGIVAAVPGDLGGCPLSRFWVDVVCHDVAHLGANPQMRGDRNPASRDRADGAFERDLAGVHALDDTTGAHSAIRERAILVDPHAFHRARERGLRRRVPIEAVELQPEVLPPERSSHTAHRSETYARVTRRGGAIAIDKRDVLIPRERSASGEAKTRLREGRKREPTVTNEPVMKMSASRHARRQGMLSGVQALLMLRNHRAACFMPRCNTQSAIFLGRPFRA